MTHRHSRIPVFSLSKRHLNLLIRGPPEGRKESSYFPSRTSVPTIRGSTTIVTCRSRGFASITFRGTSLSRRKALERIVESLHGSLVRFSIRVIASLTALHFPLFPAIVLCVPLVNYLGFRSTTPIQSICCRLQERVNILPLIRTQHVRSMAARTDHIPPTFLRWCDHFRCLTARSHLRRRRLSRRHVYLRHVIRLVMRWTEIRWRTTIPINLVRSPS